MPPISSASEIETVSNNVNMRGAYKEKLCQCRQRGDLPKVRMLLLLVPMVAVSFATVLIRGGFPPMRQAKLALQKLDLFAEEGG